MDRSEILELVLDHYHNPRNREEIDHPSATWQSGLPGCSDAITAYLAIENGVIQRATFTGDGCTISQAAASLLSEQINGQSVKSVADMDQSIIIALLGKELVQTRPRCATLGLDAFRAAAQEFLRQQRLTTPPGD